VITGNEVVVIRSTTTSVAGGSAERASPTRDSTSCNARHMSVPGENCSDSSTAPRMVRERMRSTPSTVASAASSGRVSATCVSGGGASPPRATTTMRGKSTSG